MRRLLLTLSGVASLVFGLLVGATAPVGAADASGCTGDVVVALDVELMARPGEATRVHTLAAPIPAGQWSVTTVSHDEGDGRWRQEQPVEQWTLSFRNGVQVGPTTDLADRVESATRTDEWGTVTLAEPVVALTIRHAKPPVTGGTQSVTAVCIGLVRTGDSAVPPSPNPTGPGEPEEPTESEPPSNVPARPAPRPSARVAEAPPPPAPRLEPSAWINCTTGKAVVAVHNNGIAGAVIDIAVSGAGVAAGLEVAAGGAVGTSLPLDNALENTTVDVRIRNTATGEIMMIDDQLVDCLADAAPEVSVDVDCPTLTAVVTLHNAGEEPIELTVIQERVGALDPATLDAGATVEVEVPLAGSELALRVVDGDGVDIVRRTIVVGCEGTVSIDGTDDPSPDDPTPSPDDPTPETDDPDPATVEVAIDIDCSRTTAIVDLHRDGEGSERVVVLVDGDVAEILDLEGSESRRVELDIDDADTVNVSRAGSETPIVTERVPCDDDDGVAGLVASSLVVVAVLASAAGVVPWPPRSFFTGA